MKMFNTDSYIRIESFKHNKTFHRSWEENYILSVDNQVVIGGNNYTIVKELGEKEWRTDSLALFYFPRFHWFNIVIIFETKNTYYYYCNMSSPFTYNRNLIQYVDYDIDVIVQKDGSFNVVDLDEYEENTTKLQYPKHIKDKLKEELQVLKEWIYKGQNPFNEEFIQTWYDIYINKLNE